MERSPAADYAWAYYLHHTAQFPPLDKLWEFVLREISPNFPLPTACKIESIECAPGLSGWEVTWDSPRPERLYTLTIELYPDERFEWFLFHRADKSDQTHESDGVDDIKDLPTLDNIPPRLKEIFHLLMA